LHGAVWNRSPVGATAARPVRATSKPLERRNHGGSKAFYPGLCSWKNGDSQDEWKFVDDQGRLVIDYAVRRVIEP
jgi:hypothetical protein